MPFTRVNVTVFLRWPLSSAREIPKQRAESAGELAKTLRLLWLGVKRGKGGSGVRERKKEISSYFSFTLLFKSIYVALKITVATAATLFHFDHWHFKCCPFLCRQSLLFPAVCESQEVATAKQNQLPGGKLLPPAKRDLSPSYKHGNTPSKLYGPCLWVWAGGRWWGAWGWVIPAARSLQAKINIVMFQTGGLVPSRV